MVKTAMSNLSKPRADLTTLVLHWAMVVLVMVSLASGATVASDREYTVAGVWARWLAIWPEGAVMQWHLVSGAVLIVLVAAYLAYLFGSGQWRKFVARASQSGGRKRWGANLTSSLSIVLLLVLSVTGLMLYTGVLAAMVLPIHAVAATLLIVLTLVHVVMHTVVGRFWAMWRASWQRLALGVLSTASLTLTGAGLWWWQANTHERLTIAHHEATVSLDGQADEAVWQSVQPVKIQTAHGANFDGSGTAVTVRGFHDGESVYLLLQWPDATASDVHLPLERTATGWRLVTDGVINDDETGYYEDKMAVAWADKPQLATAFTHHGQDLVSGPHRPVTRGLHYTTDGSLIDLWHWKSVRTGMQLPGRLDDNHFGEPIASLFAGHRYTGGYQTDWGGGGYRLNVCLRDDPDCQAVLARIAKHNEYWPVPGSARQRLQQCLDRPVGCEDRLIPVLLPKNFSIIEPETGVDMDSGAGALTPATAQVWSETAEQQVPLGTRVPGVVIDGRLGQGRADVRAAGHWQDGQWTLEIQRALDTFDEKDVKLMPGRGDKFMWVAPFDSSQTRHAHHIRPVRVRIEPVSP